MLYFAFTWTFGLFAYMRFDIMTDTDFYPMFQVMNSMTVRNTKNFGVG